MRALQKQVVQNKCVEEKDVGLEQVENGNQHKKEETKKQKKKKCCMKQLEHMKF